MELLDGAELIDVHIKNLWHQFNPGDTVRMICDPAEAGGTRSLKAGLFGTAVVSYNNQTTFACFSGKEQVSFLATS